MEGNRCFIVITTLCINCLILPLVVTAATNITTDQDALLALKAHITHDPTSFFADAWPTTTSVCNWRGVTCGLRHHRVTALNIPYLNLIGTIPPQLGNLSFLSVLDIRNNSFHSYLPDELAQLRRLKLLNFDFNGFNKEIPSWLGSLPNLQSLQLQKNSFVGAIPQTLANLSSLQSLRLTDNQLSGTIPCTIFNISSLEIIDFGFNQLTGSFPLVVSNLSSLQSVSFTSNNMSGGVPSNICKYFPNLRQLLLSKNMFEGKILSTLRECKHLQYVSLSFNYFTGGIPKEIGNFTELIFLGVAVNHLQGDIPYEIGTLPNLEILSLGDNNLVGPFPDAIFNMSTLTHLDLDTLKHSGILPSNFNLPNLEQLHLWNAGFSGTIPNSFTNSTKLTHLDLANNSFSGFIPSTIGNLRNLKFLIIRENHLTCTTDMSFLSSLTNCKYLRVIDMSKNPLNGILPSSISNLSISIEFIAALECKIRGNIPRRVDNLKRLNLLSFSYNELVGLIPNELGRLKNLQVLSLASNKLEGSIPNGLCHLNALDSLMLTRNQLSGALPSCLGNVTSLRRVLVASNRLTSSIPLSFYNLKDILYLNLSSNSLQGSLPLEIGNFKVVIDIDLSRNQLSSDIPSAIGSLKNLQNLLLGYNKLEGSIPNSFGEMVSLESLDLSNNNLSGVIPKSLEALLYLKYLNLSFNRLEGEIPTGGPFVNFSAQSFIGNHALCGSTQLQVSLCKTIPRRKSLVLPIVLPLSIALTIVVSVIIFLLHRFQYKRTKAPNDSDIPPKVTWRRISYLELVQATNRFSENNLLGRGSFGSVYKGILQDGIQVAIKVFNMQSERAYKSFDIECEVMGNLRHRNLVKIISSCSNEDFKALVIEYMPNGSLEKCLHSNTIHLDLLKRLDIMIDVASALEYLHIGYSTPIVHCDLKPSNILLDENMMAHVSDFGISKLLDEIKSVTQTQTLATIGYMAPEYGTEGKVSTQGDVYSFGIMLMEIFTRKKPTDNIFQGEMDLKNWVSESLNSSVMNVVDADLLKSEDEHFVVKEESVSSILSLAMECTIASPEDRINIKEVVTTLLKIRAKFHANTEIAGGRRRSNPN